LIRLIRGSTYTRVNTVVVFNIFSIYGTEWDSNIKSGHQKSNILWYIQSSYGVSMSLSMHLFPVSPHLNSPVTHKKIQSHSQINIQILYLRMFDFQRHNLFLKLNPLNHFVSSNLGCRSDRQKKCKRDSSDTGVDIEVAMIYWWPVGLGGWFRYN